MWVVSGQALAQWHLLCHSPIELHGASRRFFAWKYNSSPPAASAVPLKVSAIGRSLVVNTNGGEPKYEKSTPAAGKQPGCWANVDVIAVLQNSERRCADALEHHFFNSSTFGLTLRFTSPLFHHRKTANRRAVRLLNPLSHDGHFASHFTDRHRCFTLWRCGFFHWCRCFFLRLC